MENKLDNFKVIFPQIGGTAPISRGGHTMTKINRKLYVFGGHYYMSQDIGFKYFNDVHILDLDSGKWV